MSNDVIKSSDINETAIVPKNEFKGYTLEELRYQRALVALQKEFCKSKVMHRINRIRNRDSFEERKNSSKLAMVGSIASKIFAGLNYLDYITIGMSLFGSGRKIFKFFRRGK